jgi:hypothetical protein
MYIFGACSYLRLCLLVSVNSAHERELQRQRQLTAGAQTLTAAASKAKKESVSLAKVASALKTV